METQQQQQEAYVHAAPPQAVRSSKTMTSRRPYRDDDEENQILSNNIMYDRRIVRGNTYAAQIVTQNAQREVERMRKESERMVRQEAIRRRREEMSKPSTPPPVEGRIHTEAQTEQYLEVLSDKPIEADIETQTEAVLDKDSVPLFVPSKSGTDASTEIEDGDLFDFDLEVKPILEVLVGKALRISMIEVMEEEELESIRQEQEEFALMRDAELVEVQRLDAEAARRYAEKQRRFKQEEERKKQQALLEEKVAAQSFAKHYFADLSELVFDQLEEEGHFVDPVLVQVKEEFMPWLEDAVVGDIDSHVASRQCTDDIIQSAIDRIAAMQAQADKECAEALLLKAQEAEEAARIEAAAPAAAAEQDQDATDNS